MKGDYFSVLQRDESLKIIDHYLKDQTDLEYHSPSYLKIPHQNDCTE